MSRRSGSAPLATPSVGAIGLGVMGSPMVRNLLASTGSATIWHRSPDRAAALLDAGASWASTPREVAERCSVILLMLPDLPEVEEVLAGPNGVLAGVSKATLLVISSPSSASGIRDLAARLHAQTDGLVHLIDAPVTGGEEGAIAGTLSILVGGDDADV